MKMISVIVPCYNEKGNAEPMCQAICRLFEEELTDYRYELIFIDNCSTDGTREILRKLCETREHVKAIFNVRNFGAFNSPVYGMLQTEGDCTVLLACDFQEPVELIPEFIRKWEEGAQVVAGVRKGSRQNRLMYGIRSLYYRLMRAGTDLQTIDHFTGFGLYDRRFLEVLRQIDDPMPFLRGMVAEFGGDVGRVYYDQPKRASGKTHHSLFGLYDAAMVSFTSYTSMGLRTVTFLGFLTSIASFVIGIAYLIQKLIHWDTFNAGMAPVLIGLFFLGSIVLIALGLMGEYIISINRRVMNRPLVVEEERIGFGETPDAKAKAAAGKTAEETGLAGEAAGEAAEGEKA